MNLKSIIEADEKQAREVLDFAVKKWYQENTNSRVLKQRETPFVILKKSELDAVNLREKLVEYAAWASYFNRWVNLWSSVYEYLNFLYERMVSEFIANHPQKYDYHNKAGKAKYAFILRASGMAKEKLLDYRGKLEQAGMQHSVISRLITYKSMEMEAKIDK